MEAPDLINISKPYTQGTDDRIDFLALSREELAELLAERFGLPAYRANQLFQWVYQQRVQDPSQMTNIKKELRDQLQGAFRFPSFEYHSRQISKDGTRKYLFEVDKGDFIESVMIKQPARMTLCVSSQVGCALGCKFCQTGTMGLKRHLSTSEIVRQMIAVKEDARNFDDDYSNIVFMGMGEPLHNFQNVTRAIKIIGDDFGLGISARKITVSTVGLVPAIKKFAESGIDANLAISLNATTNQVRDEIMPINKKFPLEVLLDTLRNIPLKPRKRLTIEYVMLAGVNDTEADLARLPKLLRNIPAKINLIPYNTNAGLGFKSPEEGQAHRWQKKLMQAGFVTTIRWSKGQDIDAACGQLVTQSGQKAGTQRAGKRLSDCAELLTAPAGA